MRKILSLFMATVLLMLIVVPTYANDKELSESEFEASVAEIIQAYKTDPEKVKERLNAIDAALLGEPVVIEHYANDNARGTSPSDYTFYVYSAKRAGASTHYLMWVIAADSKEWFPGPLDYVSLEWDTEMATYYSSNGDDEFSTVQGRNTGIVVFNLEDDKLKSGDYAYGTVRVTPSTGGTLEYGSKFVHTYTSLLVSGSASYSFAPSASLSASGEASLGLSYTMGYTVNVGSTTNKWQLWADNATSLS